MSRSLELRLAALLAGAVAATTLAVGAVGLPEASAAGCGPAPSGRVAVAVVVDAGTAPSIRCVEVPERSTGYDVLIAAGHTLRIESGFLCAIDGVPATGCGNRPDFGGAYWRYFHAAPGGSWVYSTVGGGGYRMPPRCAVEGWRWSDAPSAATTPRVAPPAVTCEAQPPPPPTTTARPAPPPNSPPAAAPNSPAPGPGATLQPPGAPVDPASGAGADAGSTTGAVVGGGLPADGPDPTAAGRPADADAPDPTSPAAPEDATLPGGIEESAGGAVVSDGDDAGDGPAAEVLSDAFEADEPGGSPLGVLIGVATILALTVAAVARSVRRRNGGVAPSEAADDALREDF